MRKLIFTLLLLINVSWLQAQYSENFDGGTINIDIPGTSGWAIDNTLQVSAPNSYRGTYAIGGGATAVTTPFSEAGNTFVLLSFKHICKVDFTDVAAIEISTNGGTTWTQLIAGGAGQNCTYTGTGNFIAQGNKFSEGAYLSWDPANPTTPVNSWWKTETFDISPLVSNQATVQIRFKLTDSFGNGMNNRYGWLIEDIEVTGAPCELTPPVITPETLLTGDIYSTVTSFDVFADITDASTIAFAELYWTINSDPTVYQFGMIPTGGATGNQWAGTIGPFNVGDTICWWIEANDASCNSNLGSFPVAGSGACTTFIIKGDITFPFCDDFEVNDLWEFDAVNSSGSAWEKGACTNGSLSGLANSGVNVWAVGLTTTYAASTTSYLNSPIFNFSTTTVANLSFAINYNTEVNWDGVRLEYTNDGGASWGLVGTGLVPDANGTNWYTNDALFSSNQPGWEGSSNGLWVPAKYKLNSLPGIMGQLAVQFRFVFDSDATAEVEGFLIDDWCITVPPDNDLSATAFNSPLPGSGQSAGSTIPLNVQIENFGKANQNNYNVVYQLNNNTPVVTNFTTPFIAGTNIAATLPGYVVPAGGYTLKVWTEIVGASDSIPSNDTINGSFTGIPTLPLTFCDDFDGANVGWSVLTPGNAGSIWELGLPAFGATNSTNSGINAWDVNLGTVYTNNAETELYSPFFDFSTVLNARLSVWLNYNTEANWDGTRIDYTANGGGTWQVLGGGSQAAPDPCGVNWYTDEAINATNLPAWDDNSNGWKLSEYKLCCTTGILGNPLPIQFRFVFASDPSVLRDGFSIDDFCITSSTGDDIGISAILSPLGGFPIGSSQPVSVVLENFGSTLITSTPITYVVNGGAPVTFIWTGSIPACGSVTVSLPPITIVQGSNDMCAFTQLPTDINLGNDTTCNTVVGQPLIPVTYLSSYSDNFDSGNIGWAPSVGPLGDPATIWEFGTPNFQACTNAFSPPTCWDVNLTASTTANALTYVTSPYFDMTQAQASIIRFYQNRKMDTFGGDEVSIEYAINNGPWNILTVNANPALTPTKNWYNNGNFWDDASNGWTLSEIKNINSVIGSNPNPALIQFRFKYTSDAFSFSDGFSFDNFQLIVPIPLSITPTSVNLSVPNSLIFPGQQFTFAAPIFNNGVNTVFNHRATLTIDGSIVSVDNINYPFGTLLLPDSTIVHNFTTTWTAVPGFHQVCVYTDTPNGTSDLFLADDTVCTTVLVFDSVATSQLPNCNSFESGSQWVTANALSYRNRSTWELGAPNQTVLNSAHTGTNAWTLGLDSNYVNKDSSGLFSSLYRVQAGRCYKLSFWQQFKMEYGSDGGSVDYSTDYGVTWNRMDFTGTPGVKVTGPNTNYTYVAGLDPSDPSQRGFTGLSSNWFQTEKVFRPDANTQLIVRWRFASDFSARDEGWSIDDVCFEDLGVCTPIGLNEFAVNGFGLSQNYPNPAEGNTAFDYVIPENGQVRLVIYDMIGQIVDVLVDESAAAGEHKVNYNVNRLAPGMYLYSLSYNDQQITKRMIVAE